MPEDRLDGSIDLRERKLGDRPVMQSGRSYTLLRLSRAFIKAKIFQRDLVQADALLRIGAEYVRPVAVPTSQKPVSFVDPLRVFLVRYSKEQRTVAASLRGGQ